MEFSEDAMENRHTKLSSSDHKINSSAGNCEFLSRTRGGNNLTEQIDNKQNTELGAEITTTHQVKTETTIAAATCAEIAEVEMPLDVPELQINTQAGNLKCEKPTGEGINAVYNDSLDNRSEYDADHGQPQNENSQQSSVIAEDDDDPDNSDDESSSDSDFSDMSDGSSEESGREWKPITKPRNWVQKQIHSGANPRELLSQMLPNGGPLAPDLNDMTLWHILASMLSEPPRRQKLRYVNTFADVIQLVRASKNIIVLTGAGVSVSCGIPDFRSSDGIYSRLAKDFPDLPDPQAMFDINYFSRDPRPFYKFAREIYPGQFKPSPCHRFIKFLELKQKLLRNYTQNIDTLEQVAGIENVIECHGSFSTASCTKCKFRTTAEDIRADIFAQRIPVCPHCQPNVQQSSCASDPVSEIELKEIVENGIMKPDIVFFGEGLPEKFHSVMAEDKDKCDLLIVIGSSLKVRPVALIPSSIPAHVPQILINREQLHHLEFDVELLGDSDVIINQMCHHLGGEWKQLCFDEKVLRESTDLLPLEEVVSCNEEEDVQQYRLDNDTQSVKSNASTDIALRSAGGYSDSGFESSTLSMLVGNKAVACANSQSECETTETMKEIETNVCNLSNPETKNSGSGNLPSPSLLEDNMDAAVGFEHPAFQPFNPTLCPDSYRHLSIDSSKDSGIQCNEFSNSAVNSLLPPLAHLSDSGGTTDKHDSFESVSATVTPTKELPAIVARDNNAKTAGSTGERRIKRRQYKRLSAAERLIEGTYYCHEETSSCVFPGGQVSWSSDSDEDEEEDEVDEDFEDDDEETEQALESISMLLPAVVEADVGTEIATTQCADVSSTKRQSSVETEITTTQCADVSSTKLQSSEENSGEENRMRKNKRKDEDSVSSANKTTMAAFCSPPPVKRRCDIYKVNGKQTSMAATISSTTDTCTVITGNSPEGALR